MQRLSYLKTQHIQYIKKVNTVPFDLYNSDTFQLMDKYKFYDPDKNLSLYIVYKAKYKLCYTLERK